MSIRDHAQEKTCAAKARNRSAPPSAATKSRSATWIRDPSQAWMEDQMDAARQLSVEVYRFACNPQLGPGPVAPRRRALPMPVLPPPAGCTQRDKLQHIPPRSDLHSVFSTGKSCQKNKKSRDIYEERCEGIQKDCKAHPILPDLLRVFLRAFALSRLRGAFSI
jgi:hypothetical protein